MPKLTKVALSWAVLGAAIAVVLLSLDFASKTWHWWLSEHRSVLQGTTIVLWPSSIMMIATEGWTSGRFTLALVLSIALNALAYSLLGVTLYFAYMGIASLAGKRGQ